MNNKFTIDIDIDKALTEIKMATNQNTFVWGRLSERLFDVLSLLPVGSVRAVGRRVRQLGNTAANLHISYTSTCCTVYMQPYY